MNGFFFFYPNLPWVEVHCPSAPSYWGPALSRLSVLSPGFALNPSNYQRTGLGVSDVQTVSDTVWPDCCYSKIPPLQLSESVNWRVKLGREILSLVYHYKKTHLNISQDRQQEHNSYKQIRNYRRIWKEYWLHLDRLVSVSLVALIH